jgi:sulfide:quinone oxidoreductase
MAEIIVLGAGLGGTLAAYEIAEQLRPGDRLTVIGEQPNFSFTPSNPWVAIGWRSAAQVEVDLVPVMKKKGAVFVTQGAKRVEPEARRLVLNDDTVLPYDYLVIATGPDLAFDEIPGFGPAGHTVSVCRTDHATEAHAAFEAFCRDPGPIIVGAAQGASCFGPAYEFAFMLDTELRRRKLRDRVKMTFVTSEPYIGHLGLDGVGDTKGLLESEMREHHIGWVTNARLNAVTDGAMAIDEFNEDGAIRKSHDLPFKFAMMLPAFRGVAAVRGVAGLTNPRGFILIDKHQRNPTYPEIFGIGVAVAIPPTGPTPVPVGVPKTGFMIESMVTATAVNIGALLRGKPATAEATWNAVCLADFGDSGIAFVAQPQIPPRNVNWSSKGVWVHLAKIGFEKYFLRKVRAGESEPFYERFLMRQLNIEKLKEPV